MFIGKYNKAAWVTYAGTLSSLIGIFLAVKGSFRAAVICLVISGVCDMFDGKVARTKKKRTKEEKSFGIQLDSLSDLVCFGVLPSVIGYQIGINKCYFIPLLIFFPLAGLIRLAYFNMLETMRNGDGPVKTYIGLPITSSALICPFIFIFRKFLGKYFVLVYGLALLVIGILFISKIKIKKPQTKQMIMFIIIGIIEILLIVVVKKFL